MNDKTIDDWVFEYHQMFNDPPPFLYMQAYSESEKIGLLKKAIDRGAPLGDDDFDIPSDADTFY